MGVIFQRLPSASSIHVTGRGITPAQIHTHTHTVGGCQMVPSWFLSPCDWCLINLILHCHYDGHISKMTQRLMQQGWQSREPQYSTVCSNHLIETEIGLAYVTDTFFPLKSVCKLWIKKKKRFKLNLVPLVLICPSTMISEWLGQSEKSLHWIDHILDTLLQA